MWGVTGNTSQDGLQMFILIIAVLCIPVMLLVKPWHLISKLKKQHKSGHKARSDSD